MRVQSACRIDCTSARPFWNDERKRHTGSDCRKKAAKLANQGQLRRKCVPENQSRWSDLLAVTFKVRLDNRRHRWRGRKRKSGSRRKIWEKWLNFLDTVGIEKQYGTILYIISHFIIHNCIFYFLVFASLAQDRMSHSVSSILVIRWDRALAVSQSGYFL